MIFGLLILMVSQMTVPLVQGMLKYAWKADPVNGNSCNGEAGNNAATVAADCAKSWAEGWAFAAAILPRIDQCSATARRPAAFSKITGRCARCTRVRYRRIL